MTTAADSLKSDCAAAKPTTLSRSKRHIATATNHSGGIQGGISNGVDIYFRVAFKPTPTISKPQQTIDTALNAVELTAHGRHDACVVPRAVPIVEAMAAIVLFDAHLAARCARI